MNTIIADQDELKRESDAYAGNWHGRAGVDRGDVERGLDLCHDALAAASAALADGNHAGFFTALNHLFLANHKAGERATAYFRGDPPAAEGEDTR